MAPALSQRAAGTNHLWSRRRGRAGCGPGWPSLVITSIGVHQSAIWIHDAEGERSLSSEGERVANNYSPPSFALPTVRPSTTSCGIRQQVPVLSSGEWW